MIELVIVVAIVAIVIASGISMAMASRPSAVNAAAQRFDALIEEGRTIGRQFDTGATIVFSTKDPDGFTATLYRNRPSTLPLVATNTPVLVSTAAITEQETNSVPGFALAIHANGDIAIIPGYHLGATGVAETACPASHNYQFVLSFAGHAVTRVLPCAAELATTGTPTFAPFPAAPTQTPGLPGSTCTNCTSIPLPSATPSCPAGMVAIGATFCKPNQSTPIPSSTPITPSCPPGWSGTPPACIEQNPTPAPSAPPCIADSLGFCWYNHSNGISMQQCGNVDGWHEAELSGTVAFTIYNANTQSSTAPFLFQASFLDPVQQGDDECIAVEQSWILNPLNAFADPTTGFPNDPNLEQSISSQLIADEE